MCVSGRTVSKCSLCKTDHSFWNVKRDIERLFFSIISFETSSVSSPCLSKLLSGITASPFFQNTSVFVCLMSASHIFLMPVGHLMELPLFHFSSRLMMMFSSCPGNVTIIHFFFFIYSHPPPIFCHKTFALTYPLYMKSHPTKVHQKNFQLPSLGDIISKQMYTIAEGQ